MQQITRPILPAATSSSRRKPKLIDCLKICQQFLQTLQKRTLRSRRVTTRLLAYFILLLVAVSFLLTAFSSLMTTTSSGTSEGISEDYSDNNVTDKANDYDVVAGPTPVDKAMIALRKLINTPFSKNNETNLLEDNVSFPYYASQMRLHQALLNVLFSSTSNRRRHLKVAAVGGSLTVGTGVPGQRGYFSQLMDWLSNSEGLPVEVSYANAAIPGIGSEYYAMCINEHLNLSEVDVLLVEHASDDEVLRLAMPGYLFEKARPLEELVRAVWRSNSSYCQEDVTDGSYIRVAEHYDLTYVRLPGFDCQRYKNASAEEQQQVPFDLYISKETRQPTMLGHRLMASLLVSYFRQSILEMVGWLEGNPPVDTTVITNRLITEETARRLLYRTKPYFGGTWMDATECFLSMDRPFRLNRRLRHAQQVKESFGFSIENKFITELYEEGFTPIEDSLELFTLRKSSSAMSFFLHDLHADCRNFQGVDYYEPHLALVFSSCATSCPAISALPISVTFSLTDKSAFLITFSINIQSDITNPYFVRVLPPITAQNGGSSWAPNFCTRQQQQQQIESISIKIEQQNDDHPFRLHAVVLTYKCCSHY